MENMRKKGRSILLVLMALLFLSGLGLTLYPTVNGLILEQRQRKQSEAFLSRRQEPEPSIPNSTLPTEDNGPLAQLRKDMEAYNEDLYLQNQAQFNSREAYETPSFRLSDYGMEDEVFGILAVPKLEIEMPVYLGASPDNLALGAAHLSGTSLPIGGENTNCVIAGHRGWRGALYFKQIPSLRTGDKVIITNPWETLTYQVVEKKIIYSSETETLLIRPGQELLTLLTCDYGADGVKYRYLVICEREEAQAPNP